MLLRNGVSGAKCDQGDARMLADMVRTGSRQLRPAARDSPEAEAIKVLARTHKTLIWERTRQTQRLRHQLREYFPRPRRRRSGMTWTPPTPSSCSRRPRTWPAAQPARRPDRRLRHHCSG